MAGAVTVAARCRRGVRPRDLQVVPTVRRLRLLVPALIVTQLVLGAQPASACFCELEPDTTPVERLQEEASAVYIAHVSSSYPLLGTRFRVDRVLRGPEVGLITVEHTAHPPFGYNSCGIRLADGPWVLPVFQGGERPWVNACSDVLIGDAAVAEALEEFGEGVPAPGAVDWIKVAVLAAVGLAASTLAGGAVWLWRRRPNE